MLGDQFYMIALPWLVLQLTGNGLAMGTVLALAGVPRALLMLLGGALSDRIAPRTVLLASTVSRLALVGTLAALVLLGAVQVWMLYALALLFGVVDAFAYPAQGALLPRLVHPERLQQANAYIQGTGQICVFLGPVIAGGLIATLSGSDSAGGSLFGIGIAFVIDAFGFLASAAALSQLRSGEAVAVARSDEAPEGVFASISAGLVAVWNDAPLRVFFLLIAGINLLVTGPFAVGVPVLARERLPEGVAAFGIIMSAWGGGALVGIVLAGLVKSGGFGRHNGRMTVLMSSLGVGLIIFGLSASTPLTAAVALGMGLANGFVTVQFMTWLQRRTPARMIGRMMSLLMFAAVGLQPISTAVAGALIDLDATALFVGAGILLAAFVLLASLHPALRRVESVALGHQGSRVIARAVEMAA
jgi:MFS family permease